MVKEHKITQKYRTDRWKKIRSDDWVLKYFIWVYSIKFADIFIIMLKVIKIQQA